MQEIQDILINCSPRETRVAILVDGILEDLHIERAASRGLVGNVYVGKVLRAPGYAVGLCGHRVGTHGFSACA